MKKIKILIINMLMIVFFISCSDSKDEKIETHSIGEGKMMIDESYQPLFEAIEYTFEGQRPGADLTIDYKPENEAINAFFMDQTKTICISRDLTQKEYRTLKNQRANIVTYRLAKDAVALLINKQNVDSLITLEKIKKILLGKDTVWPTLKTKIALVFDNENTANFNYFRKLIANNSLAKNVFTAKSTKNVIDFVKKNKSSIGVIGFSWISDEDDKQIWKYLEGLTVMRVAKNEKSKYYRPNQNNIYTKDYPLTREIWMINRGNMHSINTGFQNYCIREKGQLIIHKSNLVPDVAPTRQLKIVLE
ncbi:MAG: substrate-binding domain-containing protein [Flavobacteriia bacterium]|nr:substrate-binding domain-containing protein [Flavobacteriia bacterium]